MSQAIQKLYCYADETGQDARSDVFVVVAVVTKREQVILRQQITDIEQESGIGLRKWHDASHNRPLGWLCACSIGRP